MYNDTLGTCNYKPVDLEIKDDMKPVCLYPYPVPKVHNTMLIRKVDKLVSLSVIHHTNEYEQGDPYFAQPKPQKNWAQFLRNLRHLNRQLKRKPYPIPKVCEMLLPLQGFKYDT